MTTELIKTTGITLNGDKITAVNARDLWKFLESKQDFSTWIKRRIEKYEFIEGQDYLLHKFVEHRRGCTRQIWRRLGRIQNF